MNTTDAPASNDLDILANNFDTLDILSRDRDDENQPTTSYVSTPSPNPWEENSKLQPDKIVVPDPSLFDPSESTTFEGNIPAEPALTAPPSEEVLKEFDPLADHEEKAARDAWANSEGHLPMSTGPSSAASISVNTDAQTSSRENSPESSSRRHSSPPTGLPTSSTFPSLAAIARSLAIPGISGPLRASAGSSRSISATAITSSSSSPALSSPLRQQVQLPRDAADDNRREAVDIGEASSRRENSSSSPKSGVESFDFQKFLDQMKTRPAEPVAKYLRSFLSNFAKRTFTVNDQIKVINDFLNFISVKMRECDIWRTATDAEFDNAMEGMEKLVMNRLYDFTFTPQVVRMVPTRPVTSDDLERDRVLTQRIALFGWIEEKHLDVPVGEGSKGFLMFAEQELVKMNHYKAPRDKLICILNCCKVIFGLIRHLHKEEGADSFVPILIYVVLQANPDHLISNVEFINRFRNASKLQSEAGYYLSSLMGAVSFIETMDHTSLSNITQEEFERNVEEAIQSLPPSEPQSPATSHSSLTSGSNFSSHAGEESAQPLALPTPAQTLSEDARRLLQKTGDTISKPLNTIGRIFSEALDERMSYLPGPFAPFEIGREAKAAQLQRSQPPWNPQGQILTSRSEEGGQDRPSASLQMPYQPRVRRGPSPSSRNSMSFTQESEARQQNVGTLQSIPSDHSHQSLPSSRPPSQHVSRTPTPNIDFAGLQDEIDQAHERATVASRETLIQIFPGMDTQVIEWVLEANNGDLGKSIEGLLEMSSGT